ncbi:hypothetical protein GJU39_02895 [Pedobacter petrophilus]|uniref:DUF4374 domain-containing protein n=1 Tax=Pedobacter petrophilus TaxID=1908241 RepID=A0A7K0FTV9_9SPHI|nr:hypothetical protein [Pedobacter petrophilus]MRX75025.1 hypothetical protein [Pedobacter petrophilus]
MKHSSWYKAIVGGKLFILIAVAVLSACSTGNKDASDAKFSLYILGKNNKTYVVHTSNLDSGSIKPEVYGTEITQNYKGRDLIVRNANYYRLNAKTHLFSKFKVLPGEVEVESSFLLKNFSIECFKWIKGDTLLLTGLNAPAYNTPKFVLLNAATMKVISHGNLDIPRPSGEFTTLSIGLLEQRSGNSLLLGYTYHVSQDINNFKTSDTMYVSELNYPSMKLVKTHKDIRSTYPGGQNVIQPYSFKDEKQDLYFMSCPGIALGNRPELPTAIFRIKATQAETDKSYFFNISGSSIKNHAYGMWYLGQRQVIIRSERADLFKGLNDHYRTPHFEFHVLNLDTKEIKKLDLPLDKGTRKECVIVQGNIAYIAINSPKKGCYIWEYNIKTGSLKRGLQLSGETDFILRIDKLYDQKK